MFTDIQGYTAMMQHDEGLAIKIRERHRKIFNSTTEKFNGKILQYFGDGTLSTFHSAIDAVNCAIEMQIAFQKEPVIPIRIGIHLGDVVIADDEIIGDSVNVASRIESLAVPGSVFISDKVYDEIKNQNSIEAKSLNTFEFKNVDRPMEVFAISNKGLIIPEPGEIKGKTTEKSISKVKSHGKDKSKARRKKLILALYSITGLLVLLSAFIIYQQFFSQEVKTDDIDKSIAVLAFENMSDDPDQEYFSDGISEEILNSLVKVGGLKVAGRTSSFSFKGKDVDIQSIGNTLGVGLVLEGSVRKSGNNVRITAQLISTADGYHLWSEQYDRELVDIFTIQEEIAAKIVNMLKLMVLRPGDSKQPTKNIEAYDRYLKGVHSLSLNVEGFGDALNYYKDAISLDPQFALAYAGLGDAYLNASAYGLIPLDTALIEARKAANKSILLDPEQAYGHDVLAFIHLFYDWDWEAAIREYHKALELGLNDPEDFITWYEALLFGNFEKAIRDSKSIVERDPISPEAYWSLGLNYYFSRQYAKAITSFEDALEINPDYSEAYRGLGFSYRQLGNYTKSLEALNRALQLTQGRGPAVMDLLATLGASNQKKELTGWLDNLLELRAELTIPSIVFAIGYAYLGNMDEAFIWLERTYDERFMWLLSIKVAPDWDVFRDDPRFDELIQRMDFPE